MKTELKSAWIDALRSGAFKQGEGNLNVNDTFCCLGVVCEVARDMGYPVEKGKPDWNEEGNQFGYKAKGEADQNEEWLTKGLMELFDLTEKEQRLLAFYNDGGYPPDEIHSLDAVPHKPKTFDEIADELEDMIDED
jgi:hypothetical protein